MMGYYYGYGYGMFWIMLICIALMIVAVVALIKVYGNAGHSYANKTRFDNAMNILNERYAKGEINEEEYKAKKEMIRRS